MRFRVSRMLRYYVRRMLLYCGICVLVYAGVAGGVVIRFKDELPSFTQLEEVEPARTTRIIAADGAVLKRFWVENRVPITYDQIPEAAISALTATEDQLYWRHWGVSLPDIFRAVLRNLTQEGSLKGHGASTITQQLARNLFLDQKQTWTRKVKEQLTAVLLERTYTKREIIEIYFNKVLFGNGAYGLQSAAERFFGKDAGELTLEECALLVGLLRGPYFYSPINHPRRARDRRDLVLLLMRNTGRITQAQYHSATRKPIVLRDTRDEEIGEAPYFTEYIRRYLEVNYGWNLLYKDGASVHSTVDSRIQSIAEETLLDHLKHVQKRVDANRRRSRPDSSFWAGINTLEDTLRATVVQGALVAMDTRTGHILAMVGGRDFTETKFNRAVQALRQPGSAFKPIIYASAVAQKIPATRRYPDTAVTVEMYDGSLWRPQNYDRKFLGWMTMREGLAMSRNVVTTKILEDIGPRTAVRQAKRMGITSRIRAVKSLGMGTSEVKLIDLVAAYGTFPNGGIRVEPVAILKITDKDGNVIESRVQGREREALSSEAAAVATSLLRSVLDMYKQTPKGVWRGTGTGARSFYGFRRPAAGKTGTTQNFADAWFVGFTPQIVAGVWVGFDDYRVSLGSRMSGAAVALPVWAKFMKNAHEKLGLPREEFELPPGVAQLEVCGDTFEVASMYCPNRLEEVFVPGSEPTSPCPDHTAAVVRTPGLKKQDRENAKRAYQF